MVSVAATSLSKYLKCVTKLQGLSFTTDSSAFPRAVTVILAEFMFRCTLGMDFIRLIRCHSSHKYLQIRYLLPVMGESHS